MEGATGVAGNRSRKPGGPHGPGFEPSAFRQIQLSDFIGHLINRRRMTGGGNQAPGVAHNHETLVRLELLQPISGGLGIGEPKAL